jgi:hypothetical protein
MKVSGAPQFLAVVLLVTACSGVDTRNELADSRDPYATVMWLKHMAVVDRAVRYWQRNRPNEIWFEGKELTNAIDFFEKTTQIKGTKINLSFIGPIPDRELEKVSREWKSWYKKHSADLYFDASSGRVILKEQESHPENGKTSNRGQMGFASGWPNNKSLIP